jgi:hypothetical protein
MSLYTFILKKLKFTLKLLINLFCVPIFISLLKYVFITFISIIYVLKTLTKHNLRLYHTKFLPDKLPITYLRLFLDANLTKLSTWKPAINKIRTRLRLWKRRLLSMIGRVCLLETVICTLPIYYMSVFLMLKGVAQIISSIHRRFL